MGEPEQPENDSNRAVENAVMLGFFVRIDGGYSQDTGLCSAR
jgi:hypothetical protein